MCEAARTCSKKLFYNENEVRIMLKANVASLVENSGSSVGDITLAEAGLVAIQSMVIVFAVLIILMIVLYVMKLFSKEEAPKAAPAAPMVSAPVNAATTDETLAVISASVAAMSGDDPTKRLRVVSVQEQKTGKYVWKK